MMARLRLRRKATIALLLVVLASVAVSGIATASEAKPGKPTVYVHQFEGNLIIRWNPADDEVNVNKWLVQVKHETEGIIKRRWVKGKKTNMVIEGPPRGDYKIRVRGKNKAGVGAVRQVEFYFTDMKMVPLPNKE